MVLVASLFAVGSIPWCWRSECRLAYNLDVACLRLCGWKETNGNAADHDKIATELHVE